MSRIRQVVVNLGVIVVASIVAGPALATDYQNQESSLTKSATVHTEVSKAGAQISTCAGQLGCCCTNNCGSDCDGCDTCSSVGAGNDQLGCADAADDCGVCCEHDEEEQEEDGLIHQTCCSVNGGCFQEGEGCSQKIEKVCLTLTTCASPVVWLCDDTNLTVDDCPQAGLPLSVFLSIPYVLPLTAVAQLHAGTLNVSYIFGDGDVLTFPLALPFVKEPPDFRDSTPYTSPGIPAMSGRGLAALAGMLVLGAVVLILRRSRPS